MTKIAINSRHAAYILLDNGVPFERAQTILNTTKQPSSGYYYISDITTAMNREEPTS